MAYPGLLPAPFVTSLGTSISSYNCLNIGCFMDKFVSGTNLLGLVLCMIQAAVFASLACSPESDVKKAHFISGIILGNEMVLSELLPGTVKGSCYSSYSCREFNDSFSGKENKFNVCVVGVPQHLGLGRQRQADIGEFKASLDYRVRLCLKNKRPQK